MATIKVTQPKVGLGREYSLFTITIEIDSCEKCGREKETIIYHPFEVVETDIVNQAIELCRFQPLEEWADGVKNENVATYLQVVYNRINTDVAFWAAKVPNGTRIGNYQTIGIILEKLQEIVDTIRKMPEVLVTIEVFPKTPSLDYAQRRRDV